MHPDYFIATTLVLIVLGQGRMDVNADPLVSTSQGQMRGVTMTSRSGRTFYAFLGIPFSKPPVGELRFKAPEPPGHWDGTFNATKDGPLCMQKNYLELKPQVQGQEDCLYLNVYTPELSPETPLDVMVNIHGGGLFSGTGASYVWGPHYLLDKDIALVTFNYRLGALGFLSTGDSAAPGNFGFKDQVAALKWVQNNIAALGGNPDSVTLFGQSAGGASVHFHLLSPLSAGLFHRAISQSGTALDAWAWPVDSLSLAKRQASFVGCNPDENTNSIVDCLRNVDGKTLIDSGDNFKFWSVDPLDVFVPAVEQGPEAFLPANPFYLIKTGQFHRVPWMTGVVTDEGLIRGAPILTNATLLEDLNKRFAVLGPRLFELNKSVMSGDETLDYIWERIIGFFMNGQNTITPENEHGFIDMYTDRSFVHGFHKSAQLHQKAGHENLFLYHFNYRGLYSFTSIFANTSIDYGVCHCDDLIYMFSLFPDWQPGHPDLQISTILIQMWTDFAKYGNPTPYPHQLLKSKDVAKVCDSSAECDKTASYVRWDSVSPGEHLDYLEISAGPNLTMKQDLFKERMDFWDSLPLTENNSRTIGPLYLIDLVYNFIVYMMN